MKTLKIVICVLATIFLLGACVKKDDVSFEQGIDNYFGGDHGLKAMKTNTKTSLSANYFLIAGSAKKTEDREITFMWDTGNNDYAICTVPITKFHVRFDETVEHPYIRFKYCYNTMFDANQAQTNIDFCVLYILIVCKESDWKFEEKFTL